MASYLKQYTKGQSSRAIRDGQSGFISGMNLDLPKNEIESTSVSYSMNGIPFRTGISPRSGTKLYGVLPNLLDNFYGIKEHPNGKYVAHVGERLYVSNDLTNWTETTGTWNPSDADSNMAVFGDSMVVFQADRMLIIELDNDNYCRLLNAPNPSSEPPLVSSFTEEGGPFIYRFTYTYARYVDDVLVAESGAFASEDYKGYYKELTFPTALDGSQSINIANFIPPTESEDGLSTQWTHVNFYRTRDIGENTQGQEDYYYLVFSYNFTETGAGIGTMQISGDPVFKVAGDEGILSVADDRIIFNEKLNKLYYKPLEPSLIGSVSDGVIFCQRGTEPFVNYSMTGVVERAGYYFEGSQFEKINGKLTSIVSLGGYSAIICTDRVYLADEAEFSSTNSAFGADIGNTVGVLNKFTKVDDNIGVVDAGTIAKIDQGRFIAVCNDGSVRVFDRGWGATDYARQKVTRETKRIAGKSSSIYNPDGYYIVSYRNDTTDTTCDQTLRLGMAEDVGTGWCFYGGDGWIKPQLAQSYFKSTIDGNMMMFAVENDGKIFWIETYDGPIGSGLLRQAKDKANDSIEYDVSWQVNFPEMNGESIGYTVRHLKSLFSIRPYERDKSILADTVFKVGISKDGSSEIEYNYANMQNIAEIVFSKDIYGKSLDLTLEVSNNSPRLTSYETFMEVIDRPTNNFVKDESILQQSSFYNNVYFDMGRYNTVYNLTKTLASGNKTATDTGVFVEVVGPDGRQSGVSV